MAPSIGLILALVFASGPKVIVVVIPAESRTASAAATHLVAEIGRETEVVTASSLDPEVLAAQARLWPDAVVLVLDPSANQAWVVREDAPLLLRKLPERSDGSAFALAVAAAELARLAAAEAGPRPLEFGLAASVGFGVVGSPGFEPILAAPVLSVDVELRGDNAYGLAGIRWRGPQGTDLAVPGRSDRTAGSLRSPRLGDSPRVEYSRSELSLRAGAGLTLAHVDLAAFVDAGVSLSRARGADEAGIRGEATRAPAFAGFGVEAHFPIAGPLRVAVGLDASRLMSPADYVGGSIVLAEGPLRAGAWIGLSSRFL
ncbi:MAG: hypothetical protein HYV07_19450 [Deltaproteobacteria bacterium]|nr:hypothetical protein [Deltaproteobacteria bacterium]